MKYLQNNLGWQSYTIFIPAKDVQLGPYTQIYCDAISTNFEHSLFWYSISFLTLISVLFIVFFQNKCEILNWDKL